MLARDKNYPLALKDLFISGDISICIGCAEILIFNEIMVLEKISPELKAELGDDVHSAQQKIIEFNFWKRGRARNDVQSS